MNINKLENISCKHLFLIVLSLRYSRYHFLLDVFFGSHYVANGLGLLKKIIFRIINEIIIVLRKNSLPKNV